MWYSSEKKNATAFVCKSFCAFLLLRLGSMPYGHAAYDIQYNGPNNAVNSISGYGVDTTGIDHVENALNGSHTSSLIRVTGQGSTLNFSAANVQLVNHTGNQSRAISIENGGSLHFDGSLDINLSSTIARQNYGLSMIDTGSMVVEKDLRFSGNIGNAFIFSQHGSVEVKGNTTFDLGRISMMGSAIVAGTSQSNSDAKLNFWQKTTINNDAIFSNTMMLHGTTSTTFDELEINSSGYMGREVAINDDAALISTGKTVIKSNRYSLFDINIRGKSNGFISLGEDRSIVDEQLRQHTNTFVNIGEKAYLYNDQVDAAGIDIHHDGASLSHILIKGVLDVRNGQAIVSDGHGQTDIKLEGGHILGNIDLSAGDDRVELLSGSMAGEIIMGAGSDHVIIHQGVDISGLQSANGHRNSSPKDIADHDQLTLDGVKNLTAHTSGAGSVLPGINFLNWNDIYLVNGAEMSIAQQIFAANEVGSHQIHIDSGSIIKLATPLATIYGSVNNNGVISMANGLPGDNLVIEGDYQAGKGALVLDTVLEGDASLSDKLTIKGDAKVGETHVKINQVGGGGAQTKTGIKVIEILGKSDAKFTLDGRVVAGQYDYFLRQHSPDQQDGNWYLRSELNEPKVPIVRPEPLTYINNHWAANSLFQMRLHDRLGEAQYVDPETGKTKVSSLWLRQVGAHARNRDSSEQVGASSNRFMTQLGGDVLQWSQDGVERWHLGLMAGYARQNTSSSSVKSTYRSQGTIDGYSVGLYGTYFANAVEKTGVYWDGWLNYGWFDNSVEGQGLQTMHYKSKGLTASVEAGYTWNLGENKQRDARYFLQPKAQLTWMNVRSDNFIEQQQGMKIQVDFASKANLQTRLGLRAYRDKNAETERDKEQTFKSFVEVNWIHNSQSFGVAFDGDRSSMRGDRNTGEVKVGLEGKWSRQWHGWGNIAYQMGQQGYKETKITAGMKYIF
ncbi:autotransporter outer membrane beta-barrel domain-containing protein [Comamonas sp. GB3 AK4-5]|uniref:autotransporter outer membrane beta-barrel domain-containing protein n=1 Tax=Comamonas sp. GB3 AK4-5 TaxID=3231487 RepID=UPI00351DEB9F